MDYPMRLNRYLSACGLGSRRGCEQFVKDGSVQINGQLCTNLGTQVNESDEVVVNGRPARPKQDVVIEQKRCCPATCGDGAGATEYLDDHALPVMRAPLQLGSSGLGMVGRIGMFSRGGFGHKRPMPHLEPWRTTPRSPRKKA